MSKFILPRMSALAGVFLAVTCVAPKAHSQELPAPLTNNVTLDALWKKALQSPEEYLASRVELIGRKTESVPLLQAETKAPEAKRRWLAQAVLNRIADPAKFERLDAAFAQLVKRFSVRSRGIVSEPRLNEAFLRQWTRPFEGFDTVDAVPFLIEQFYGVGDSSLSSPLASEALLRLGLVAVPALCDIARDPSKLGAQSVSLKILRRIQEANIAPKPFQIQDLPAVVKDDRIIDTWFAVLTPSTNEDNRAVALLGIVQLKDKAQIERLKKLRDASMDAALQKQIDPFLLEQPNQGLAGLGF